MPTKRTLEDRGIRTMAWFLAGIVLGILIEHYHLFGNAPLPFDHSQLMEKPMHDIIFMALTMGMFGLMALAIRLLQR